MPSTMRIPRLLILLVCVGAPLFESARTPAATAARPSAANAPPGGAWRMVFNDEFDGTALKTALWQTCDFFQIGNGCRGGAPGEMAWHQPDDVLIGNGLLRLRAQQRTVFDAQGGRHDVTSGFVTTKERFTFRYGYFETRVKMPRGRAMWPQFFTTPVRRRDHIPEIDVFEMLGTDTTRVYQTYHFPDAAPPYHQIQSTFVDPADFANGFHTFGALWEPGLIIYYIDGVERWRVTDRVTDEPTQIALRFGVGVNWEGNNYLDHTSVFPAFFDVDYVRVWQRGEAPSGTVIDDAAGFDNAFAISHELQRSTGYDEQFEGDATRWSASTNQNPTFVVWDVSNARTFEATTFFWPGTGVRNYRFFVSTDLINFVEAMPSTQQSQPGWNKVLYQLTLPAGARLVKVQFPQMDQTWHTALTRVAFGPDGHTAPTATPAAQPTNTPLPTPTNTATTPPTSTPAPPPGGISIQIRAQNSAGTPFANLRTSALNLKTAALLTQNTTAQGNAQLSVAPGNYKICQDIPAAHRPLFGTIDGDGRACVWFTLASGNALNLLFAYEATGVVPTATPQPTATPAPGAARVTYRVVASPKSIQNFRFTDTLTGASAKIELDDASPDDNDGVGNERSIAVSPGSYSIAANVPSGWALSDLTCTSAAAQINRAGARVTVNATNGTNVTCTFAMGRLAEVTANVWHDQNRDGRPAGGEPGLSGWTAGVYCNAVGSTCPAVAQGATTVNGAVTLRGIRRDNYLVCVASQPGWSSTYPTAPTISNGRVCYWMTLLEGTSVELWYGFASAASSAGASDPDNGAGYPVPVVHAMPDVPHDHAGYAPDDAPFRIWLPVQQRGSASP